MTARASRSSKSGRATGCRTSSVAVSTADKIAFVNRLSAAGLPVIEVSAFVSPKWVPQMADAAEVFAGITRAPGTRYTALVPNLAGLERALGGRRQRSRDLRRVDRNVQPQEHQPEHRRVARDLQAGLRPRARGRPARARLSVDGVRLSVRRRRAGTDASRASRARLLDLGVFEVAVSDTIGIAHPGQVPRVLDAVLARRAAGSASRCTSTTRAARRSPTSRRAAVRHPPSTRRPAAWAAVRTRRARPATWPPTT